MTADYERTYAHKFRDTLPNLMCRIVAIEVSFTRPPAGGCHTVTVRSLKDICCVLARTHTHTSPLCTHSLGLCGRYKVYSPSHALPHSHAYSSFLTHHLFVEVL